MSPTTLSPDTPVYQGNLPLLSEYQSASLSLQGGQQVTLPPPPPLPPALTGNDGMDETLSFDESAFSELVDVEPVADAAGMVHCMSALPPPTCTGPSLQPEPVTDGCSCNECTWVSEADVHIPLPSANVRTRRAQLEAKLGDMEAEMYSCHLRERELSQTITAMHGDLQAVMSTQERLQKATKAVRDEIAFLPGVPGVTESVHGFE